MSEAQWRLQDQIGNATYDRDGIELQSGGLYLDLARWQAHIFLMTKLAGDPLADSESHDQMARDDLARTLPDGCRLTR